MAGDWIKMRIDLPDDPAVISISAITGLDQDSVVGKLHRLWSWADRHTKDGTTPGVNSGWVDRYVACKGFAEAMVSTGWLIIEESSITFPGFDRHNGESSKRRCDAQIRQRLSRENRDKGVTGTERDNIPRPFVRHVLSRDAYQCVYCGVESSPELESSKRTARLSIDHIIPVTRGGKTEIGNLATCCRACNNEKNDRTPGEWDLLPTFLHVGVIYDSLRHEIVTKSCDKGVTREDERRREGENQRLKDVGIVGTRDSLAPTAPPSRPSRDVLNEIRGRHTADLADLDWSQAVTLAESAARKIPPLDDKDRRAWLKYGVLASTACSEAWLADTADAVSRMTTVKKSRQACFVAALKQKANEQWGIDEPLFKTMVRSIEIPSEVWESPILEVQK